MMGFKGGVTVGNVSGTQNGVPFIGVHGAAIAGREGGWIGPSVTASGILKTKIAANYGLGLCMGYSDPYGSNFGFATLCGFGEGLYTGSQGLWGGGGLLNFGFAFCDYDGCFQLGAQAEFTAATAPQGYTAAVGIFGLTLGGISVQHYY
jgi:hypothetical protein